MNENNRSAQGKDSVIGIIVIKSKPPENLVAEQCFDNVVKSRTTYKDGGTTEQIRMFINFVNYDFANCSKKLVNLFFFANLTSFFSNITKSCMLECI